jgi:molybdenum cofactor cytidylyltransferase
VVVVLGASADVIRSQCSLDDARVLVNEGWEEGMASSIRLGVGDLSAVDGCVVMTCDQPTVTVEHLSRLMVGEEVKASRYAGRNGIPAFFPATVFGDLMELRGDKGARELLAGVGFVELTGGELDLDTGGDLVRVRELFG